MDLVLLLAQDGATVETAEKTVGILERILQGGVPLICLAVAVIFGVVAFWIYRQNVKLTKDAIKREGEIAKQQAEREAKVQADRAALEKDYREKVEALLREMLERGEDSQQVITGNTEAVKDMTQGLQQLTTRIEYIERTMRDSRSA